MIMGAHKKYDLESIKQERWFYIIHRNQCTLCGKEFSNGEETFIGHLLLRSVAVCDRMRTDLSGNECESLYYGTGTS